MCIVLTSTAREALPFEVVQAAWNLLTTMMIHPMLYERFFEELYALLHFEPLQFPLPSILKWRRS